MQTVYTLLVSYDAARLAISLLPTEDDETDSTDRPMPSPQRNKPLSSPSECSDLMNACPLNAVGL